MLNSFFRADGVLLAAAGEADDGASWSERAQQALQETLGPPIKALHEPVDAWLGSLPMWVAVACAMGLYLVALVWVWLLGREFVFRGAPDDRWWRDLRIWSTAVLLPYIVVYCWLGR